MIGEVYAPSNYVSADQDPSKSAEEKLEIINSSQSKVTENRLGAFRVTLPYVWGASAEPFVTDPNKLYLHDVNVGDEELYGHGIGTRLLQAAVRYGASIDPNLKSVLARNADLGLVNTLIKGLGKENVRVSLSAHDHYGFGTNNPLEAIFEHQPSKEGEPYRVWEVEALVDSEQINNWELPINEAAKE
jgi:GNAT superfamily N-acetyltransferase